MIDRQLTGICGRKRSGSDLKHYRGISLEEMRKGMEISG